MSSGGGSRLRRGDLLPRMVRTPPGPRARRAARDLQRLEAPGINTLIDGVTPLLWREARGANVLDTDGNRYLDLTAGFGVAAVGHRHPAVVRALRRQSGRLIHGLGDVAAHPARLELARRLTALAPFEEARVYFAISGADAVEIALKTALLATGRGRVVAFEPAYHGLTSGPLQVSSRAEFRRPFRAHHGVPVRRLPWGCAAEPLEDALADRTVAAVIVEPAVGREGLRLPPPGWLSDLAAHCRRHGTLLVVDEIFTGFGRLGAWFFAVEEGATPDLICAGKALGGGLPIAAVLGPAALMDRWASPSEARHTATFVAHPLACAAAVAALDVLREEDLLARARGLGAAPPADLASRPDGWDLVGRAALWSLLAPTRCEAAQLVSRARDRGLLVLAGGADGRHVQLVPPLVITDRQWRWGLAELATLMAEMRSDPAPAPP